MADKWFCNQACDSPGCVNDCWMSACTSEESKQLAVQDGWVQKGKKIYCPDCAPMYWQPAFTEEKHDIRRESCVH